MQNYAFIDGQNLYMGTAKRIVDPWQIDLPDRKRASSLYKKIKAPLFAALDDSDVRRKIQMR